MEIGLTDYATKAIHTNDGEDVENDVEDSEHVENWHRHLHHHLHDDFEGLDFFEKDSDAQVPQHEREGEIGCSDSVRLLSVTSIEFNVGENSHNLAENFDYVQLLFRKDYSALSRKYHKAALNEVDSSDRYRNHAPEAGSDLFLSCELIIEDEEKSDGKVEKNQQDLDPAFEEAHV